MLTSALVLAAAVVAAAPAQGPPSGAGSVLEKVFHSDALGVDKHYWVYLPPGYQTSNEHYPVVIMLHGLGGAETDWFGGADLALAAEAAGLRAIIVTPDGDAGFYTNGKRPVDYAACLASPPPPAPDEAPAAYCVRKPRYEDYIVKDLVKHIDRNYRTISNRASRAIGGLSMGGFGAFMLAMRHPDVFSAAASHAGVLSLLQAPPQRRAQGPAVPAKDLAHWGEGLGWGGNVRNIMGKDMRNWRAHDPAILAAALRPGRLALYLDCGTDDEYGLDQAAQVVHDALVGRGVEHRFALVPGGRHDSAFWKAQAHESMRFFAKHFGQAAPRKE